MNNRTYEIVRKSKYDGYHQRSLASIVYKFFDKKTGSAANTSVNEKLTQELENSKEGKSLPR